MSCPRLGAAIMLPINAAGDEHQRNPCEDIRRICNAKGLAMLHFFFLLSALFTSAPGAEDTALANTVNAIRPAIEAAAGYTPESA